MGAGCHTLRERAPSYALDERTHQPTPVIEKEMTTRTHTKVLKAVWEFAPIQYGSELTKPHLWMTWIRFCLFVLFACLFYLLVCLVFCLDAKRVECIDGKKT